MQKLADSARAKAKEMTRMSIKMGGKIKTNDNLEKSELKRINSRKSIPLLKKDSSSTSIKIKKRVTMNIDIDDEEKHRNVSRLSFEANIPAPI